MNVLVVLRRQFQPKGDEILSAELFELFNGSLGADGTCRSLPAGILYLPPCTLGDIRW